MNIPDEAVEAAYAAWLAHKSVRSPGSGKKRMRAALEAGLSNITLPAFTEGSTRCYVRHELGLGYFAEIPHYHNHGGKP
jgi:hypothetical protein